eukprot:jgi/Mesvir1/8653/Mv02597-RA.1
MALAATLGTEVPYTVFSIGDATLHQLHTSNGRMFVMSEVAVELFQESPGAFAKELRAGRYTKVISTNRDILRTVVTLGLPAESSTSQAVTLITSETVEALLADRRRGELLQPFRLALLKLASQEAARLMAGGEYEIALPVAMDAVKQGQQLFAPNPGLQIFPLYLLAAQANLGLNRVKQCEDFLGLASWLALRDPEHVSSVMRSQLARLYGQMYALEGKSDQALRSFAEDVYHSSLEYGPEDVRSSMGYYNLSKIFMNQGEKERGHAFSLQVIKIWRAALGCLLLGEPPPSHDPGLRSIPLGRAQLLEVVDMFQDICITRADAYGDRSAEVAEAYFVLALALALLGEVEKCVDASGICAGIYRTLGRAAAAEMAEDFISKVRAGEVGKL